jgi:hypothetical protein
MKINLECNSIWDWVLPGAQCRKCGNPLVIFDGINGENNTLYVGCPIGKEEDGHTHYSGIPASTLRDWGWEIPPRFMFIWRE